MATNSKDKDKNRKVATSKSASGSTRANPAAASAKSKPSKKSPEAPSNGTDAHLPTNKSRKRAADDFEGDDAQNIEAPKQSSTGKAEKSKKKAKATNDADTKLSKVDGHPIETAKSHPGGDMVEVELVDASQNKKSKAAKKAQPDTSAPKAAPKAKTTRKPVKKTPQPTKSHEPDELASDLDDPVISALQRHNDPRLSVEPELKAKSRKSKPAAKKVNIDAAAMEQNVLEKESDLVTEANQSKLQDKSKPSVDKAKAAASDGSEGELGSLQKPAPSVTKKSRKASSTAKDPNETAIGDKVEAQKKSPAKAKPVGDTTASEKPKKRGKQEKVEKLVEGTAEPDKKPRGRPKKDKTSASDALKADLLDPLAESLPGTVEEVVSTDLGINSTEPLALDTLTEPIQKMTKKGKASVEKGAASVKANLLEPLAEAGVDKATKVKDSVGSGAGNVKTNLVDSVPAIVTDKSKKGKNVAKARTDRVRADLSVPFAETVTQKVKKGKALAETGVDSLEADLAKPLPKSVAEKAKKGMASTSIDSMKTSLVDRPINSIVEKGKEVKASIEVEADSVKADFLVPLARSLNETAKKGQASATSVVEKVAANTIDPITKSTGENVEHVKEVAGTGADNVKANLLDPLVEAISGKKKRKAPAEAESDTIKKNLLDPLSEAASEKKKRKVPANDTESETIKAKLLDPLSEAASGKAKKSKKSEPSTLEATGGNLVDFLSSGIEVAAEQANAAKDYITKVAGDVQMSLTEAVTDVAEETIEAGKISERKVSKAISKKGKGKAKDDVLRAAEGSSKSGHNTPEPADNATASSAKEEKDDEDEGEDDHTVALLKGFESSDDEEDDLSEENGFKEGMDIPQIPNAKKLAKKSKATKGESEGPGVVYVGRIPHGFYEHEMRAYFSQFGPISHLRLSRNKQTGRSKHYAFIEFSSESVASIVANAMDNYLLFGHILKCKLVPKEQVHEDMWKGSDRRFKVVPHNRLEGKYLEMAMGREGWEKRIEGERERRESKKEKAKEVMGYEFDGGALKGVEEVPVKEVKAKAVGMWDNAKASAAAAVVGSRLEVREEIVEEESTIVNDGEGTVIVSEDVTVKKVRKRAAPKEKIAGEESKKAKRAKK